MKSIPNAKSALNSAVCHSGLEFGLVYISAAKHLVNPKYSVSLWLWFLFHVQSEPKQRCFMYSRDPKTLISKGWKLAL